MFGWIIETIAVMSLTCASIIKCAAQGQEQSGMSERVKSARREPPKHPKVDKPPAKAAKSSAAPPTVKSKMNSKMTTGGDDGGYEACPDLNSAQLRKIAATA